MIELATELVGTVLAQRLGLRVAIPATILLSPTLLHEIEKIYNIGILSPIAIGLEWRDALLPFGPRVHADFLSDDECAALLALDLYLANGDRTELNPNLALDDVGLFVFDFEHCLELPSSRPEIMFEAHIEILPNLLESHVLNERFSSLQPLIVRKIFQLAKESLDHLPRMWLEAFGARKGYLEYVNMKVDKLLTSIGKLA